MEGRVLGPGRRGSILGCGRRWGPVAVIREVEEKQRTLVPARPSPQAASKAVAAAGGLLVPGPRGGSTWLYRARACLRRQAPTGGLGTCPVDEGGRRPCLSHAERTPDRGRSHCHAEFCELVSGLRPPQAHRNLSQLPNFAFSVPLAYFLLSQQADLPEQEFAHARGQASALLQQALTMFPGALMPLLEHCSVRPDAAVAGHRFFGPDAEIR